MVTQEHLETLERDGVVHIPGVLSPAWVEYLRACTDWQIEHPHVWAIPGVASGLYDYIQVAPAPGCADEGNWRAGRREGRRRETETDCGWAWAVRAALRLDDQRGLRQVPLLLACGVGALLPRPSTCECDGGGLVAHCVSWACTILWWQPRDGEPGGTGPGQVRGVRVVS